MRKTRRGLAGPVLVMATSVAGLTARAVAQSEPPEVPAAGSDSRGIEEVVVTAQKRPETLQKSPAAITALSAEQLQTLGVTDAVSLENVVPGLAVRPEGAVLQLFIRGVGNNVDTPNLEGGVALNINGVYLPRYASTTAFFDLDRVEVLPGPQGTLYGGAAAGGVINLFPRKPGTDDSGEALLETGDYGLAHGFLAQSLQLGDRFGLRGVIDYERHDGYQSMGLDSEDRIAGRLSALWNPTSEVSILLWAQSSHDGGRTQATVNSPFLDPSHPWNVVPVGPLAGDSVNATAAHKDYNVDIAGGQLDWQLGDYTLTYVPGYVQINIDELFYAGYLPAILPLHEREFSNELRLANGGNNRLQWLVGLYSLTDNQDYGFNFFGTQAYNYPLSDNRGYAGFGQATYKVTDALRLTAGGRYSYDSKDAYGNASGEPETVALHWTHGDWKAGVEYDLGSRSLLYGTIQTGYVPGGYSQIPDSATTSNDVEPEKLRSYTVGSKNTLLSNRLQLNDEAYYYNYTNYQVVAVNAQTGQQTVYNAQKAVIYGNQLNLTWLATDALQLSVGLNAMSAYFRTLLLPNGSNYGGYQLANAPPLSLDLGGQYVFELGEAGNLTFNVKTHHEAGHWLLYNHFPDSYQSAYFKTDVDATYRPVRGHWSIGLWARNLENTPVFGAGAGGGQPGPASMFLDPPRTFGARVTYEWK